MTRDSTSLSVSPSSRFGIKDLCLVILVNFKNCSHFSIYAGRFQVRGQPGLGSEILSPNTQTNKLNFSQTLKSCVKMIEEGSFTFIESNRYKPLY